jgi:hypothetical protein
MTCTELDDVLEAYLDGDLPHEEHREVSGHLSGCESCRRKLALAERVASALRSLPQVRCPDDVAREMVRRVTEAGRTENERRAGWTAGIAGFLSQILPSPFPWKASLGLAAAILIVIAIAAYPPSHWVRSGQPHYTKNEIEQAKMVVGLAFGYVDHAARLAEKILEKEDVPDKVIVPIRKGLDVINPSEKKEKSHEKRSFVPYARPFVHLCIAGMGR